jgi:amino acid transporter
MTSFGRKGNAEGGAYYWTSEAHGARRVTADPCGSRQGVGMVGGGWGLTADEKLLPGGEAVGSVIS